MNIDKKIDELFLILDDDEKIKKIKELKYKITDKEINLIRDYQKNPTIETKKKIFDNKIINEYLKCENDINYLIMEINSKFKRSKNCACNKW